MSACRIMHLCVLHTHASFDAHDAAMIISQLSTVSDVDVLILMTE